MIDPFDQITSFRSLLAAERRAARGTKGHAAAAFRLDLEPELLALQDELCSGAYRPGAYRTFTIDDPKPRMISAAPFRDRVVHHTLISAIEPTLEGLARESSYACRPGKGNHAAVRRCQALAKRFHRYVKLDIRHHFETVSHQVLMGLLADAGVSGRTLALCALLVSHGAPGSPVGVGLPIGNLTSQHFANLYLGVLDRTVEDVLQPGGYIRYMDDMLLFADHAQTLHRAADALGVVVREQLRQELKTRATRHDRVHAGVPYLGFRVFRQTVRLDGARARRLKRRLRGNTEPDSVRSVLAWAHQADTRQLTRRMMNDIRA